MAIVIGPGVSWELGDRGTLSFMGKDYPCEALFAGCGGIDAMDPCFLLLAGSLYENPFIDGPVGENDEDADEPIDENNEDDENAEERVIVCSYMGIRIKAAKNFFPQIPADVTLEFHVSDSKGTPTSVRSPFQVTALMGSKKPGHFTAFVRLKEE